MFLTNWLTYTKQLQVKADALHKNTLLPAIHPAVQLVQRVGTRIVEQTTRDINRGATSHMEARLSA